MDRQEFSAMIKEARESRKVSKYKVHLNSRLTEAQVSYIECATRSYGMKNVIAMLNSLGAVLKATKTSKDILIDDIEIIPKFLNQSAGTASRYSISKDTGISKTGVKLALEGKAVISVDTFLKLTDYFGYTLSIVDKPSEGKGQPQ